MKRILSLISFLCITHSSLAQYSGVISVPSTSFSTLASLITSLNVYGVSGALTVNIAAGYTEQVPMNGYSLSASGNFSQAILFQKSGSGANPLLVAYSGGNGTPGSMNQDGIWRLIGSDYITIDGVDLLDTNTSNPSTMEFGFGFFKANSGNGCWHNTIKNCVITLNRINNASGNGPAEDGSRGIDVVNAYSNVHNAVVTVTSTFGSHSNNRFYSNLILNCNIGIAMIGFTDLSPYTFADHLNEIGGNAIPLGNKILNFGGGGTANASIGIKASAQYDLIIQNNLIQNNTGSGINHGAILKGIQTLAANEAEVSILQNTLTLTSGGASNQLVMIENTAGSNGTTNKVNIKGNTIINCMYVSAVSPSYYGIWNTASSSILNISQNSFINNSSNATSGSSYLIYNNGAVKDSIRIDSNYISFVFASSISYGGTLYALNNSNGTLNTHVSISGNLFKDFLNINSNSTGNLYFIHQTNSSNSVSLIKNQFKNLRLNHSGSLYFMYNSSATQSLLSVCSNSIVGSFENTLANGAIYVYYGNGNSPASSTHSICQNNFSHMHSTGTGSGVFYGIYNSDGNTSPFPKKIITYNIIDDVNINSTGNFYGYYLDALGDGNGITGSDIHHNRLSEISRAGNVFGLYLTGFSSPNITTNVYHNQLISLNSSGNSSTVNAVYMINNGAGILFAKNKLALGLATGSSAVVNGIYINSTASNTICNNIIGDFSTTNSSASNAINGIYVNAGSNVHSMYNTVYLNAVSTGGNFNSNAMYASSTATLNLRNSILYNTSSGGSGVAAAYRRSSSNLTTYANTSNHNLFYTGIPSSTKVILQNGTSSYQNLTSMQTLVSPRDAASITQTISFLSLNPSSPNYLHINSITLTSLESAATSLFGIDDDFDTNLRQGSIGYNGSGMAPDIGADEFELNVSPCTSVSPAFISATSQSLCAGKSISLTATNFSSGTGIQFQWKVSSNSGGPYTNVTAGSGIMSPEYSSAALNTGTYYFVLETTCTNVALSAVSQQATIVVIPVPTATAAALSNLLCEGQSLYLIASSSIPQQYQWYGPNGFVSETQNPILTPITLAAIGNYSLVANSNGCSSSMQTVSVNISSISLSISASSQVLCSGNSSTLNLNTSANSFTWSTGSSNSSIVVTPSLNTTFTVTATNTANCTKSSSITLQLITPSIQANGTLICGNSSTTNLSALAFTPSIVNWYASQTSTNVLQTGTTFSLILNSDTTLYAQATNSLNGCSSVRLPVSATLSANPNLLVTASSSLVCPGKTTVLNVTGALTYSWISFGSGSTKTVSPSGSSVYTVIGKNSFGCSSSNTIAIATLTNPILYVQQSSSLVCPSSVAGFTASGAISYTWSNGSMGAITSVTPGSASNYTVFGTNNEGCVASKIISVNTRSVPIITISQSKDTICSGELVTFTAIGANSYTWLPSGKIFSSFSIQIFDNSVVNAIGKSVNTCTSLGYAIIQVSSCTSIMSYSSSIEIVAIPNPANEKVLIKVEGLFLKKISIRSLPGNIVFQEQFYGNNLELDIRNYSKGMYLISVEVNNVIKNLKLIVD